MLVEHIDIPISKRDEFFGGMFGVNRSLNKRRKLPRDTKTVYEAMGLYFAWANSLSDDEREKALKRGEFALRDLQTQGHTVVREGSHDYKHYEGLPTRERRIDTIEMRRQVFSQVTALVVELQNKDDRTGATSR